MNPVAATQINADTAGLTSTQNHVPTAAPVSRTEATMVHSEVGQLGYLFGHNIVHTVAVPLDQATGYLTELGGHVPAKSLQNILNPVHFVDGANVAQPNGRVTITQTIKGELGKLRKALGF